MSTPRIEFMVNCKPATLEDVKKTGALRRISLRELTPGVWVYQEVVDTKYADIVCGSGHSNGISYEVFSRYLNDGGKIVSETDDAETVSGMLDVKIIGLDHPEVAIFSKRYGISAYFIEAPVYQQFDKCTENMVEIDFEED